MRTRILAAAVVLGLGIAGITWAQLPSSQPRPLAVGKAALLDQVVKLSAEIELLQLDHDADREILLAWMKAERTGSGGLAGVAIESMLSMMGNAEATKSIKEGETLVAKAKEKGEDDEAVGRRILAEALKKQLEPMRRSYGLKAAELARKRLELDAFMKQYLKAE